MVFELVKESEIAIKRNRGGRRKREKEREKLSCCRATKKER